MRSPGIICRKGRKEHTESKLRTNLGKIMEARRYGPAVRGRKKTQRNSELRILNMRQQGPQRGNEEFLLGNQEGRNAGGKEGRKGAGDL